MIPCPKQFISDADIETVIQMLQSESLTQGQCITRLELLGLATEN